MIDIHLSRAANGEIIESVQIIWMEPGERFGSPGFARITHFGPGWDNGDTQDEERARSISSALKIKEIRERYGFRQAKGGYQEIKGAEIGQVVDLASEVSRLGFRCGNEAGVEIANAILEAAGLDACFYVRDDGTVTDGGVTWEEFDANEAREAAETLINQAAQA